MIKSTSHHAPPDLVCTPRPNPRSQPIAKRYFVGEFTDYIEARLAALLLSCLAACYRPLSSWLVRRDPVVDSVPVAGHDEAVTPEEVVHGICRPSSHLWVCKGIKEGGRGMRYAMLGSPIRQRLYAALPPCPLTALSHSQAYEAICFPCLTVRMSIRTM